jgi:hypothetical protein
MSDEAIALRNGDTCEFWGGRGFDRHGKVPICGWPFRYGQWHVESPSLRTYLLLCTLCIRGKQATSGYVLCNSLDGRQGVNWWHWSRNSCGGGLGSHALLVSLAFHKLRCGPCQGLKYNSLFAVASTPFSKTVLDDPWMVVQDRPALVGGVSAGHSQCSRLCML